MKCPIKCAVCECCPTSKARWLLQVSLGLLLLLMGIGKLVSGLTAFVEGVSGTYEGSWIPMIVATGFLYVLPFLEIFLGLFLLSGYKKTDALSYAGLLFVILLFGNLVKSDWSAVQGLFVYIFVTAFALKMGSCGCEECKEK